MTQLLDVKSLKRGSHEVILVNFAIFTIIGPEDSSIDELDMVESTYENLLTENFRTDLCSSSVGKEK